jgi:hypothetical protein
MTPWDHFYLQQEIWDHYSDPKELPMEENTDNLTPVITVVILLSLLVLTV